MHTDVRPVFVTLSYTGAAFSLEEDRAETYVFVIRWWGLSFKRTLMVQIFLVSIQYYLLHFLNVK